MEKTFFSRSAAVFLIFGGIISAQTDHSVRPAGSLSNAASINENEIQQPVLNNSGEGIYSGNKSEIKKTYLSGSSGTDVNVENKVNGTGNPPAGGVVLTEFKKNYAGINVGQFFFNTVSLSYERLSEDGSVGLKFFTSYNFSPKNLDIQVYTKYPSGQESTPEYRRYTAGFELNIYPVKQKKVAWFCGPGVQIGNINYTYSDPAVVDSIKAGLLQGGGQYYYYGQNTAYYAAAKRTGTNAINTSVVFNTGFLWRITTTGLYVNFTAGVGLQRFLFAEYKTDFRARGSFQMLVGYSF